MFVIWLLILLFILFKTFESRASFKGPSSWAVSIMGEMKFLKQSWFKDFYVAWF